MALLVLSAAAVPARLGWLRRSRPDSTQARLTLMPAPSSYSSSGSILSLISGQPKAVGKVSATLLHCYTCQDRRTSAAGDGWRVPCGRGRQLLDHIMLLLVDVFYLIGGTSIRKLSRPVGDISSSIKRPPCHVISYHIGGTLHVPICYVGQLSGSTAGFLQSFIDGRFSRLLEDAGEEAYHQLGVAKHTCWQPKLRAGTCQAGQACERLSASKGFGFIVGQPTAKPTPSPHYLLATAVNNDETPCPHSTCAASVELHMDGWAVLEAGTWWEMGWGGERLLCSMCSLLQLVVILLPAGCILHVELRGCHLRGGCYQTWPVEVQVHQHRL